MTTAALISKKVYKYGYFEIRCKLPNKLLSKDGANFWLYGNDGSKYNEIDVFETESISKNSMPTNYHWGISGSQETDDNIHNKRVDISKDDVSSCLPNLTESFHTYGVDWQPDKIVWYLDKKPVRVVTTNSDQIDLASNFPVSVKLFVDDAWRFAGKGYPIGFKDKFIIDYVRVYDKILPISEKGKNSNLQSNWDVNGSDGSDYAMKFYLPSSSIINVSTNYLETNFDTKIELFNEDGTRTGYYNDDIAGSLKSEIKNAQLNSGYYYIVVDGYNGYTGDFKVTVDYSTLKSGLIPNFEYLSDLDDLGKNSTSFEAKQLSDFPILYPNPVNDVVNIKNVKTTEIVEIKLTDLAGNILKSFSANGENISMNVLDIKPGFYLITVNSNNQVTTRKVRIIR